MSVASTTSAIGVRTVGNCTPIAPRESYSDAPTYGQLVAPVSQLMGW